MTDQIHTVKITYRSGVNGRVAVAYAKVPYGGMVDIGEKFARLLAVKQVRWFRLSAMTKEELAQHRGELARWTDALNATVARTHIDVLA
jgi:hypothetical protein